VADGAGDAHQRLHRDAGPRAHRGRGHRVACLRFANGALGVIQATTSVHPATPRRSRSTATRLGGDPRQDDVLRWTSRRGAGGQATKERFARRSARRAARATRRRSRTKATPASCRLRARHPDEQRPAGGRPRGAQAVAVIQAIYESAKPGARSRSDFAAQSREPSGSGCGRPLPAVAALK